MVSQHILDLCANPDSISSLARDNPTEDVPHLAKKLVKENTHAQTQQNGHGETLDLDAVAACGRFVERPSDLFLKIYGSALETLAKDPLDGMCSPSLLASTGVIPFSIISVIPDIVQHYADVIVTAEQDNALCLEIDFWEASTSAKIIVDALLELNKRAASRQKKVVVKIMYDRGNLKQIISNHQIVPEKTYVGDAVKLPSSDQVPFLDLEVENYHRPALGTFHAKYMIVDSKIALINSNNIQDRVNMEMMCHVEGKICEGFIDMALLSWNHAMKPPLPTLLNPPRPLSQDEFHFGQDHPHIAVKHLERQRAEASKSLQTQKFPDNMVEVPELHGDNHPYANSRSADNHPNGTGISNHIPGRLGNLASVTKHLNTNLQPDTKSTLPPSEEMTDFDPFILHKPHKPFPIALVNRKAIGSLEFERVDNPQDAAWLAAMRYAQKRVFIQTPTFNAHPIVDATLAAIRRGIEVTLYVDLGFNDAGEELPKQGGTNEQVLYKMFAELKDHEKDLFKVFWYTGKDMSRPINASQKKRNCHVKIMIVDDAVGVQGNGNQDSQSWFHSQEANILIDSPGVCQEWLQAIRTNQNTHLYGRVQSDGIWRDDNSKGLVDAGSVQHQSGFKGLTVGLVGAIKRVQGSGGF